MGPRKRHAHHIELARRGSWRKAVWVRSTPPSPPHMAMAIKQLYAWLNSASASSSRLFCVRTRWASLFHTMSSSLHRRSYKGRTSRRTRRRVAAVPRRGWPSGGLSLVDELPRLLSSALVSGGLAEPVHPIALEGRTSPQDQQQLELGVLGKSRTRPASSP